MTLERASELVKSLKGNEKIDLFCFFEQYFDLDDLRRETFAGMCGFGVVIF